MSFKQRVRRAFEHWLCRTLGHPGDWYCYMPPDGELSPFYCARCDAELPKGKRP